MLTIGICGPARAGKDTLAQQLNMMDTFVIHRMADPLKRMLETGFGLEREIWDSPEKEQPIEWLGKSPRYLAQTIGTEWGRELVHTDLWVLLAEQKRLEAERRGRGLIVPDVRFENEARWIRELDNGILVQVVRDERPEIDNAAHPSEAGIASDLVDLTVYNNKSIESLRNTALAGINNWSRARK